MSKRDKLIKKMRENPKGIRFEELDNLLVGIGFDRRQPRKGSSHYIYRMGPYKLVIKRENPVKPVYIKEAIEIIDLIEKGENLNE
ncbi:toxin HicA [Thermoanaerobacterium sp. DL9XJH110]|uniref:toxin HicA n=1 Tax=Thermoanaerobacterium sp. DL9XJH110 TaxID=3386643 RepID=UPI003BB4D551